VTPDYDADEMAALADSLISPGEIDALLDALGDDPGPPVVLQPAWWVIAGVVPPPRPRGGWRDYLDDDGGPDAA
jgi:hypothetical protein